MVPCGAIWGILTDLIGRRPTLILTTGMAGTFEFMAAFANNYWYLFACKFLAGCAYVVYSFVFGPLNTARGVNLSPRIENAGGLTGVELIKKLHIQTIVKKLNLIFSTSKKEGV